MTSVSEFFRQHQTAERVVIVAAIVLVAVASGAGATVIVESNGNVFSNLPRKSFHSQIEIDSDWARCVLIGSCRSK
jgi:hypothetical protein